MIQEIVEGPTDRIVGARWPEIETVDIQKHPKATDLRCMMYHLTTGPVGTRLLLRDELVDRILPAELPERVLLVWGRAWDCSS